MTKKKVRNLVNNDLTTVRLVEQAVKSAKPAKCKLGEITIPVVATDFEVMILGRMLDANITHATRMSNMLQGLVTSHGVLPAPEEARIKQYITSAALEVDNQKYAIGKIIDKHPLAVITQIKGVTSYSLGVIMSMIKDPRRFPSPSNLFVYAGVAPKNGVFPRKATINLLRKLKHEECGRGKEPEDFTEFGYKPKLQSKLYNVAQSLLKARGFFYKEYLFARKHLEERAINNNECFIATKEDSKASAGVMVEGKYYMRHIFNSDGSIKIEKKNQSLIMWSSRNASWRMAKIILHIIYVKWMEHLGAAHLVRELYAIEYLGHQRKITLEEVITWEKENKSYKNPFDLEEIPIE